MRKTNDLRTAGSTHLIEAARRYGSFPIITQSIIFGYGYSNIGAVDETDAFGQLAGDATDEAVRAMSSAEEQAFSATGLDGIALRYGLFYGADAAHMARMLNRGSLPVPRHWAGTLSFVHHEDAAVATVAALEHGAAGRAYNIVDDQPTSWREYIEAIAETHGTRRPLVLPDWTLRLVAPYAGTLMTRVNVQASNVRARRELGWAPRYTSVREGLERRVAAHEHPVRRHSDTVIVDFGAGFDGRARGAPASGSPHRSRCH